MMCRVDDPSDRFDLKVHALGSSLTRIPTVLIRFIVARQSNAEQGWRMIVSPDLRAEKRSRRCVMDLSDGTEIFPERGPVDCSTVTYG
jgi:hypothetical protein